MQALVIVLNQTEKLEKLLMNFVAKGITGGTLIDSKGMAKELYSKHKELPMFGTLSMLLNESRPLNKTIFLILDDEKVEVAKQVVRETLEDISKKGVGIMFTVPVTSVEGLNN